MRLHHFDPFDHSNDALRKHGILPPKEAPPPSPSPPPSPTLDELLDEYDLKELQELSEDAPNSESERLIAQYRRQRIADERKEQQRARFGRVYPIGRDDYTREVTEASKIDEDEDDEEKGTGVICFLYKDGYATSSNIFFPSILKFVADLLEAIERFNIFGFSQNDIHEQSLSPSSGISASLTCQTRGCR